MGLCVQSQQSQLSQQSQQSQQTEKTKQQVSKDKSNLTTLQVSQANDKKSQVESPPSTQLSDIVNGIENIMNEMNKEDIKQLTQNFDFVPEENILDDITSKFKIIKVLGKGASCKVFEVTKLDDDYNSPSIYNNKEENKNDNKFEDSFVLQHYALKQMDRNDDRNDISFKKEVKILKSLKHKNILRYDSAYIDMFSYFIATNLCNGGALLDRIRKLTSFSELQASNIIKTILLSIKYCHDNSIAHRDLKPGNIVYDKPGPLGVLKLIDFGDALVVDMNEEYNEICGTILYLPPEIRRKRQGWEIFKGDIWSIGIICYILVTGKAPFMGKSNKEILKKIENFDSNTSLKYPEYDNTKISVTCKQFISYLLTKDTKKRPTVDECLKHPWINSQSSLSNQNLGKTLLTNIGNFHDANILKKIIVEALIREMTVEHKILLIKAFREIDYDKNGYLDMDEIAAWLKDFHGFDENTAKTRANEIMNVMDPKNLGKVTLKDFVKAKVALTLTKQQTQALNSALGNVNKTNRKIKVSQLRDFVKKEFVDYSSIKEANKVIDTLKPDKNGCITVDELSKVIQGDTTQIAIVEEENEFKFKHITPKYKNNNSTIGNSSINSLLKTIPSVAFSDESESIFNDNRSNNSNIINSDSLNVTVTQTIDLESINSTQL